MILRRITEHVKAQNWFAVAIDFVIVVARRLHRYSGHRTGMRRSADKAACARLLSTASRLTSRSSATLLARRVGLLRARARRHAVSAPCRLRRARRRARLGNSSLISIRPARSGSSIFNRGTTYDELRNQPGASLMIGDAGVRSANLANHFVRLAALDCTLKATSEYSPHRAP